MDQLRILLVDDHTLLRDTLKLLIAAQPNMEVAGEAGNASEALERAASVDPAIILLDITLPDRSGISLLPELIQQSPSSRIIMLTMHDDPTYLRAALAAGAVGYVVKSSSTQVLLDAIHAVDRGEKYIDPSLRDHLSDQGTTLPRGSPISRLSERERQVLFWLSQGMRYQVIADKLGVSVKTVETYRSRLTAKLGFKDRADMMRFAIETGILGAAAPTI